MELSTQNHMLQNFKLQVNILVQVTLSEAIKKSPQIQFPSRSLDK